VFVAGSLGLAELVATWLKAQGVEARVMDALTLGGVDGLTPWSSHAVSARGIEVWVADPDQAPRAQQLIAEHEEARAQQAAAAEGEEVEAVCEECGETSVFPGRESGTTQNCPSCGAYLDVPGEDEGWDEAEEARPEE
jgi:hypothetical protein